MCCDGACIDTLTPDLLVIGGGIIGINVAREFKRRHPDASVHVLDKEATGTEHSSGRNSGVLHAGFYYTADSHKAAMCREGNALLTAYCLERGLPINRCGKLVVTRSEAELESLDELKRRGDANGVELQVVTVEEARSIEPRAKTVERALFSMKNCTGVRSSLIGRAIRNGVVERVSCLREKEVAW